MRKWNKDIIEEWVRLRSKGASYKTIGIKFSVAKSTISYWLRDHDDGGARENKNKEWLKRIQPLGALANKKIREERLVEIQRKVADEVNNFSSDKGQFSEKALLSMLYWAEGSKGRCGVTFVNTDPQLICLFIRLFRQIFNVSEDKFRIRLHLHYYHKESEERKFWSALTNVPESQFTKTYRKRRGTNKIFRKNSHGICSLRYHSESIKDEIMFFARGLANRLVDDS